MSVNHIFSRLRSTSRNADEPVTSCNLYLHDHTDSLIRVSRTHHQCTRTSKSIHLNISEKSLKLTYSTLRQNGGRQRLSSLSIYVLPSVILDIFTIPSHNILYKMYENVKKISPFIKKKQPLI